MGKVLRHSQDCLKEKKGDYSEREVILQHDHKRSHEKGEGSVLLPAPEQNICAIVLGEFLVIQKVKFEVCVKQVTIVFSFNEVAPTHYKVRLVGFPNNVNRRS